MLIITSDNNANNNDETSGQWRQMHFDMSRHSTGAQVSVCACCWLPTILGGRGLTVWKAGVVGCLQFLEGGGSLLDSHEVSVWGRDRLILSVFTYYHHHHHHHHYHHHHHHRHHHIIIIIIFFIIILSSSSSSSSSSTSSSGGVFVCMCVYVCFSI